MCGIWAYIQHTPSIQSTSSINILTNSIGSDVVACRGPDKQINLYRDTYTFTFHRLSIHDLSSEGDQPFIFEFDDGYKIELMCNGEIYNYKDILNTYSFQVKSKSDCEIIGHLIHHYKFDIAQVMNILRGEFAFIACSTYPDGKQYLSIARDTFGVRPLYYGLSTNGIILSSLLGGITNISATYENDSEKSLVKGYHFPPGHVFHEEIKACNLQKHKDFTCLLKDTYSQFKTVPLCDIAPDAASIFFSKQDLLKYYTKITEAFINAVKIRLDSERDVGFLLSGGLDSSLIVAVATKICGFKNVKTFSIGFNENAPDLEFAWTVADHLNTNHTPVIIDTTDALNTIPAVIKALETYDITTIRASTPQYLLAQYIKEITDIKVILNGDGSDEVSMGYIYNYFAPGKKEAHEDSLRLLQEIHCYDGLRVDRTLGAHGLEARVPFLDIDYVETYLSMPIELRKPTSQRIEKQLLRDAFYALYPDILPKEIFYRKKEAFSDGVSTTKKSWFTMIQERAAWENKTEKDWYKEIFDAEFPNQEHICPHYWMPQWTNATDPSARTLTIY
jgi:asparagine synthase (glutamine-hydrolysing)